MCTPTRRHERLKSGRNSLLEFRVFGIRIAKSVDVFPVLSESQNQKRDRVFTR